MKKYKKEISYLDWEDHPTLTHNHNWVIPQAWSWINEVVQLVRSPNKTTWSFDQTLQAFITRVKSGQVLVGDRVITLAQVKGLWTWMNSSPRGKVVNVPQITSPYNASVPLLLAPFKLYRGVGYEHWDWSDTGYTHWLDQDLASIVGYRGTTPPWTPSELLQFREMAATVKSGHRAGTVRSPKAITNLVNLPPGTFKELPRLAKLILTQCWCWHPTTITNLSVQSITNWDQAQPPLISDQVLVESQVGEVGDLGSETDIWKL